MATPAAPAPETTLSRNRGCADMLLLMIVLGMALITMAIYCGR